MLAGRLAKVATGAVALLTNRDLFPTRWSLLIFLTYMALFVSQGLLVTASRHGDSTYPYNPTTVVLVTEVTKLLTSSAVFLKDNSVIALLRLTKAHFYVLAYYMIPAVLYCLYNNLSFTNLAIFDPTTYFMFMQIRLIMTGVIYQFVFRRRLSQSQWLSLLLVTVGCMVQKMDVASDSSEPQAAVADAALAVGKEQWHLWTVSAGLAFILLQVCCSVFAGVYNEYLIKNIASDVDIMIQNVFMYIDSIVCNLVVLAFNGDLKTAFSTSSVNSLLQIYVVAIVLNNALVGIVTSLFLQNLNSIVKAFASAIELVFTALLSFILLGIPLYWNTILAVGVVSYAVVLYAQSPIKNSTEMRPARTRADSKAGDDAATAGSQPPEADKLLV